jgi:hypothetical protein
MLTPTQVAAFEATRPLSPGDTMAKLQASQKPPPSGSTYCYNAYYYNYYYVYYNLNYAQSEAYYHYLAYYFQDPSAYSTLLLAMDSYQYSYYAYLYSYYAYVDGGATYGYQAWQYSSFALNMSNSMYQLALSMGYDWTGDLDSYYAYYDGYYGWYYATNYAEPNAYYCYLGY